MLLLIGACTKKSGTGNSTTETDSPSGDGTSTIQSVADAPVELPPIAARGAHAGRAPEDCDVVIVDSSLGGVFAALESARQGVRTCLTSMTNWIGGQVSTQSVCAMDAPHHLDKIHDAFIERFAKRDAVKTEVAENGFIPAGEYDTGELDLFRAEAMKCLQPLMDKIPNRGTCWVSYDCCRPKDAETGMRRLLAAAIASGNLVLWEETVPKKVQLGANGEIESVQFVKRKFRGDKSMDAPYALPLSKEIAGWYDVKDSPRYKKQLVTIKGKVFIDATETGELGVLAKARMFQGELDEDCNEIGPENVMGFVYPLNLGVASTHSNSSKNKSAPNPLEDRIRLYCPDLASSEQFTAYAKERFYVNWHTYDFWPEKGQNRGTDGKLSLFAYRRLSDNPPVSHMNFGQSQPEAARAQDLRGGNDYTLGNFLPPPSQLLEKEFEDWRGGVRVEELAKAECHSLAFARWLESQPEVKNKAPKSRRLTPIFDVKASNNFYDTGTGLSKFPYVRDTRHIRGYRGYCMKPRDFGTRLDLFDQEKDKTAVLRGLRNSAYYAKVDHTIGITSYEFDLRRYPDGRLPPDLGFWDMRLSEIPLEATVSENIPNLLAAGKNIALHQLVASAARTQPFECNVGRGVGAAAAVAVRAGRDPHRLMESRGLIRRVQKEIRSGGGTIRWFDKATD